MATVASMDIQIGANVSQATQGLNTVSQSLAKTAVAATKVDSSIAKTGTAVAKTGKDFTGLSRVIQDLPYGFNAISNNLTNILPAAGAAGLAISAITTAITFATIGFEAWTRGFKDNTEAIKEEEKALKGFEESAAKQLLNFKELAQVAADANAPMKERLAAVKELRQEYGPHLQNMKDEQILAGDLGNAYKELNKSLLAKIVIQAAEGKLTPLIQEQLDLQLKNAELQKTVNLAKINQLDTNQKLSAQQKNLVVGLQNESKFSQKAIDDNNAKIASLDVQINNLFNDISGLISKGKELELFDVDKEKKKIKEVREGYRTFDPNIVLGSFIRKGPQIFDQATVDDIAAGLNKTVEVVSDKIQPIQFKFKPPEPGTDEEFMAKMAEATKLVSSVFDQMFASIERGASVFEAVSGAVKDLIIDLAKAAIKAAALYLIINVISGGTATFGAIFGQLSGLGNLLKFATGGVVTRPTLALIGEQGPEMITPLNSSRMQSNGSYNERLVAEISGQQLRILLRRTEQSNAYIN